MYSKKAKNCLALVALLATPLAGQQADPEPTGSQAMSPAPSEAYGPADRINSSLSDPQLSGLVSEVLERNPLLRRLGPRLTPSSGALHRHGGFRISSPA